MCSRKKTSFSKGRLKSFYFNIRNNIKLIISLFLFDLVSVTSQINKSAIRDGKNPNKKLSKIIILIDSIICENL